MLEYDPSLTQKRFYRAVMQIHCMCVIVHELGAYHVDLPVKSTLAVLHETEVAVTRIFDVRGVQSDGLDLRSLRAAGGAAGGKAMQVFDVLKPGAARLESLRLMKEEWFDQLGWLEGNTFDLSLSNVKEVQDIAARAYWGFQRAEKALASFVFAWHEEEVRTSGVSAADDPMTYAAEAKRKAKVLT